MTAIRSILCATDGSRASVSAVRRAIALASPDTELVFLAVVWRVGAGPTERAVLAPRRAEKALRDAAALAAAAHFRCECVLEHAPDPAPAILAHARDHDLLVLGAPPASRATGILGGSVATAAAHHAPVPVLLARGRTTAFPRRVVVATNGSAESGNAVRLAADIARRADGRITLVYAGEAAMLPRNVAEQAALLSERVGVRPDVVTVHGRPQHAIAAAASAAHADLLVVGSRGLHGARALGSISERVAHDAPMSVLIARPEPQLPVEPQLTAAAVDVATRARERALAERLASGRLAMKPS
jgi:nucleotide-binding universal stress UspA family protein